MNYNTFINSLIDGEIKSPTLFEDSCYIKLRITGVGITERYRLDNKSEILYDENNQPIKYKIDRDRKNFFSEEFLNACVGIPVLIDHPNRDFVNGANYNNYIVGVIVKSYIDLSKDEVWGIARIYDLDVLRLIDSNLKSTSPCIKSEETLLSDGVYKETFKYIDHLALVVDGYWDQYSKEAIQIDNLKTEEKKSMSDSVKKDETLLEGEKSESSKIDMIEYKLNQLLDHLGLNEAKKDGAEVKADDDKEEAEVKDIEHKQGIQLDNLLSKLDIIIGKIEEKDSLKKDEVVEEVEDKDKEVLKEENIDLKTPALEVREDIEKVKDEIKEDEEESIEEEEEKKVLVDRAYNLSSKYKDDGASYTKERAGDTKLSYIQRWLKANKAFVADKYKSLLNRHVSKEEYALCVDAMISVEEKLKSLESDRLTKSNNGIQLVYDDGNSKEYKNVF